MESVTLGGKEDSVSLGVDVGNWWGLRDTVGQKL